MAVTSANRFLNLSEMTGNAEYIWSWLLGRGWTPSAIAGVLGNMQTESTINPGIWQNLDEFNYSLGFGLVQWTPATKYTNWCIEQSLTYNEMDSNLLRIIYEVTNNIQWIHPTMSFYDFTQWAGSPYEAGVLFVKYYERPANPNEYQRGSQAEYWYNELSGLPPFTTIDKLKWNTLLTYKPLIIRRRGR